MKAAKRTSSGTAEYAAATAYAVQGRYVLVGNATTDRGGFILYGSIRVACAATSVVDVTELGRIARITLSEFEVNVPHNQPQAVDLDFKKRYFSAIRCRSWRGASRTAISVDIERLGSKLTLLPLVSLSSGGFGGGLQPVVKKLPIRDQDFGRAIVGAFERCE